MKNQVAIVAGVGPALGKALCQQLAAEGYTTFALSRSGDHIDSLSSDPAQSGAIYSRQCNLGVDEELLKVLAEIEAEHGPASVYIHNAQQLVIKPLLETSIEEFEQVWRTTVRAAFLGAQVVVKQMLKQQSGTLLFTGATASIRGGANFSAFSGAKFGLRSLAQSIAREYGNQGIHAAHILLDGLIWGAVAKKLHGAKQGQCMQPQDIATQYLQLIKQPRSTWTQELDLRPNGEKF